jgi:serine/threonine protein kinase
MSPHELSSEVWADWRLDAELLKARVKASLLGSPNETPRLGSFTLVRCLGHGASGSVYEARDERDGSEVALKLLRQPEAQAVSRFKAEFRGLTHVVHENVAQLYELFTEGEAWFFTMELVRGAEFTRYVRFGCADHACCDLQRLHAAIGQVFSAVHALHASDILHRDLKPSNVLVTDSGRAVLLDFGLLTSLPEAQRGNAAQAYGTPAYGTPAYIAPELHAGHAPSAASDAYSIGAMLFHGLTGRLPFRGTPAEIAAAQRAEPAPEARALCSDVPADLNALCAGLLERDPGARLTIGAALDALQLAPRLRRRVRPDARSRPFVGRNRELEVLRGALADTLAGKPTALLIAGRSGIGKSALVRHFATELPSNGLLLHARCHERESMPYKAFDSLIDELAQHLHGLPAAERAQLVPSAAGALLRIFPQLAPAIAPQPGAIEHLPRDRQLLREAAFAALKELLRRIAQRAPLVLIVDDLQWADLDSASRT